jgi:hypothetical protein
MASCFSSHACTVAVSGMWSTVLVLYCNCTIATCPHVLQILTVLPARTSYRLMMALISGALETFVHALGTYETSCTVRPARLFFMLEAHGTQRTIERVAAQSPTRREAGFGATTHVALRSPPSRSGAMVHVAAPEPFSSGWRVPEPLDTWQP